MRPLLLSLLLLLLSFYGSLHAQDQYLVDSLERELKSHQSSRHELGKNAPAIYDTTEADILFALSRAYLGNTPAKALDYAKQTLVLSEKIGYDRGIANGYNNLGVFHFQRGEYPAALDYYKKALQIRHQSGDEKGKSNAYNNIGELYRLQGNYSEALRNHLSALKTREKIGDRAGMGRSYNNIGLVYMNQGNHAEALKNYLTSLEIAKESGNKQHIAALYTNIGIIRSREGNLDEALQNYEASLAMAMETGDKQVISTNYINIGSIYQLQGRYPEALDQYRASLRISEETEDNHSMANSYFNIGSIYIKQKMLGEAEVMLDKSLSISKQIGNLEGIKNSYLGMASLDSVQGRFDRALDHYKLFILYRDSLVNEEITKKTVRQQMQFDFDKQQALLRSEQEKKDAMAREELQKQKLLRNGFVGGFGVVLLFATVFFVQRNKIKKGKKRSDELLLNILPEEVAEELKTKGSAEAKQFEAVTVMFTDFKNFTQISEKLSPTELVHEIHTCFKAFDQIIAKYNIEKIKTMGDSYMCAGGLPVANTTHACDVVAAAWEIQEFMLTHSQQHKSLGREIFEIRIGIHTGPVVAGIVGDKKFAYDIWGNTVNIASRMESSGEAGKINISDSTYELVKDEYSCTYRGKIHAKNKGEIDMYFVDCKTQGAPHIQN